MMTSAEWWAKVRQARERTQACHERHVAWTLHRGTHAAELELRDVPSVGVDVALIVDGDLRRSRLYRSHEQVLLADATRTRARRSRRRGGGDSRDEMDRPETCSAFDRSGSQYWGALAVHCQSG